jgi:tetratricopeptide (TPR) repeat protein
MTLPTSRLRRLLPAAALLLAANAVLAQPGNAQAVDSAANTVTSPVPDRAGAYYHEGLAHLYEQMAITNGRPDYATQAVEEYKLALSADSSSPYLEDGLADLYFKIGRIREAVSVAQERVKQHPDDIAAHTLLGKVYLRSLGDMQGAQANEMLQLAIGEYQKLGELDSKNVEDHLVLGQLYGFNHDSAKAEAEFKQAQSLDNNSEEAVLNMARLYQEQGQGAQAVSALTSIAKTHRSPRVNVALGASYDLMHKPDLAANAYQAALDQDPGNTDAERALAAALLNDNKLEAALPLYQKLVKADPTDVESTVKISEIQRRQGHYDAALSTLDKAKTLNHSADNLELSFNEAVLYDAMGQYDQAVSTLQAVLAATGKPDNSYTDQEKSNRAIFLDRLAIVQNEQNKTTDAVATYKQMAALGGQDYVLRAYQGEVDSYRGTHQWKQAVDVAAQAAKALPDNTGVQLMYAFQLADNGQADEAFAIANAQLKHTAADRETYVAMAGMNLRLHRMADVMKNLDAANGLANTPDQRLSIDLLRATVLDQDKKYDEAEAEYRKALAIDPNNATVLNDLGYMLANRGTHLQEALKMIQQAVTQDPQNGSFLDSLGWVYFKLGQYDLAEANLQKAIARISGDASIHDHLGQVYAKTGRLKLAVAQWQRSISDYAQSLPADADPADVAKVKRSLEDARIKLARNSSEDQKP